MKVFIEYHAPERQQDSGTVALASRSDITFRDWHLPTTGVNDLQVHGNDLIAATQGRAI